MRDSIRLASRPVILLAIAAAVVLALAVGDNLTQPGTAHADVQLEMNGSCEPDIRPNEPALVSCTVTVTNNGTEAATNLNGSVFIAEDCQIPSRFSFIDRTYNDTLERTLPQGLAFDVPDIGPGVTASSTTRIATENFSTGATGGSVTIASSSQTGVSATVDLCWDVSSSADAPPTDLRVTKSPLGFGDGVPEPPTVDPDIGGDAIIDPPPPSEGAAQFEIVITNTSNDTISNVNLLDVSTGSALFLESDPPATLDELGRPTWDAGDLAPGQEFRALVSFAAAPDSSCSYADGVAIVTATGLGGEPQHYVAFSDSGIQVGPCLPYPDGYCAHYAPGGQQATVAPCDESVCWSTAPDGYSAPVSGCEGIDYCWFTPPGSGSDVIQPCEEPACWFNFGAVFLAGDVAPSDYYSQVPCDQQFCTYTSPDGASETRSECEFPVCW
jgi:hypothetical protein